MGTETRSVLRGLCAATVAAVVCADVLFVVYAHTHYEVSAARRNSEGAIEAARAPQVYMQADERAYACETLARMCTAPVAAESH